MTQAPPGITDLHVHIQPWRQLKPAVADVMRQGKEDHWDRLIALMDDPKLLLQQLDDAGIWRVGLINYPSPDLMGFTDETTGSPQSMPPPTRIGCFRSVAFTRDSRKTLRDRWKNFCSWGSDVSRSIRRTNSLLRTRTPWDWSRWDESTPGLKSGDCR